jgi:ankyrin repeat protein
LKFLVKNGVNVSRVFDDGRSPLHLAAELANDVEVLEYLRNQGCLDDLNRQDIWGWTPLHHAIIAAYLHTSPDVFQKVQFLLSKGADVNIKGRAREIFWPEKMPADGFTPGQMCRALDVSLYKKFESEVKIAGGVWKRSTNETIMLATDDGLGIVIMKSSNILYKPYDLLRIMTNQYICRIE